MQNFRCGLVLAAMFSSRGAAWSLSRCSRTSCSRRFEKRFTRASVDSEDFPVSKFVVGLNGPLLTRKPGTPFILGIVSHRWAKEPRFGFIANINACRWYIRLGARLRARRRW
jgi:hypothetical protein